MRLSENSSLILDPPVDINGGAVTTPWVNMGEGKDLAVMISTGAIAASASAAVTLNQDKDGDGGDSKALAFTHYYTVTTASGGDIPTKTVASTLTIGATDDNKIFIIPIDASQLDQANDFAFVRAAIANPGQSCILSTHLILTNKRDTVNSAST